MVRWSARSRRQARQDEVELLASNNKVSGEDDTSDNGKLQWCLQKMGSSLK